MERGAGSAVALDAPEVRTYIAQRADLVTRSGGRCGFGRHRVRAHRLHVEVRYVAAAHCRLVGPGTAVLPCGRTHGVRRRHSRRGTLSEQRARRATRLPHQAARQGETRAASSRRSSRAAGVRHTNVVRPRSSSTCIKTAFTLVGRPRHLCRQRRGRRWQFHLWPRRARRHLDLARTGPRGPDERLPDDPRIAAELDRETTNNNSRNAGESARVCTHRIGRDPAILRRWTA